MKTMGYFGKSIFVSDLFLIFKKVVFDLLKDKIHFLSGIANKFINANCVLFLSALKLRLISYKLTAF